MRIVMIIISVLVSVISGIVSANTGFDTFQSITIGILSFLCLELIDLSWFLGGIFLKQNTEKKFIDRISPYSIKIQEINNFYYEIERDSQGEKDLFSITCSKAIDNLYILLKDASGSKKIEITSDYIINVAGVFEALNITHDKRVRLTFPIKEIDNGIISSAEDRKFFETVYNKISKGEVSNLLILMILDNEDLLQNPQVNLVLEFYARNSNYECKYILARDFIEACEHNRVSTSNLDFGIYGPKMLFVEESLSPYRGVYYKEPSIIDQYTRLFDEVWNFEAVTHSNPKCNDIEKSRFTPYDFFNRLAKVRLKENAESVESKTESLGESVSESTSNNDIKENKT